MANTELNGSAFIGEIRQHASDKAGGGTEIKYFATVAFPHGDKNNRKYQYLSCYVSKSLNRLFEAAFSSQFKDEDDHVVHTLSSQIASISIEVPFFEVDDGYLNGTGILKSVMFE